MYSFFINTLNAIIRGIGSALHLVLGLLPNSPFVALNNSAIAEYLPTLNYFLPIAEMISVGEGVLAIVVVYYFYQAVLRTINLIG
jgi:hypothetical protein